MDFISFENLDTAVDMTVQGMGTTFLILIIFYFLVKGLSIVFVER